MKKIFFLLLISVALISCQKDFNFHENEGPVNEAPNSEVKLHFGLNGAKGVTGEIVSGQTVTGDSAYYFSFWLTDLSGQPLPTGTYTIKNSTNQVLYLSANAQNGIDFKFPLAGTYSLNVTGSYNGSYFSFAITVIVTGATPPPPPATTPTSPVRLYGFNVSGGNATVNVAISKFEYQNYSSLQWFHVTRINSNNFVTNQAVTSEPDSIRFTLNFPAINNSYVEFNGAFHDGSTGGMWLTPNAGNPPSILYSGSQNSPYNSSGSFFGFRLHLVSGGAELRTHSGTLLLTTVSSLPIPGNNGDGPSNNYQVRWTGYTHYVKTSVVNPTLRYRIGLSGSYSYLSLSQLSSNNNYYEFNIPGGTTGEFRFQFGSGTGTGFVPANSEMSNSMYYISATGELVKNL